MMGENWRVEVGVVLGRRARGGWAWNLVSCTDNKWIYTTLGTVPSYFFYVETGERNGQNTNNCTTAITAHSMPCTRRQCANCDAIFEYCMRLIRQAAGYMAERVGSLRVSQTSYVKSWQVDKLTLSNEHRSIAALPTSTSIVCRGRRDERLASQSTWVILWRSVSTSNATARHRTSSLAFSRRQYMSLPESQYHDGSFCDGPAPLKKSFVCTCTP